MQKKPYLTTLTPLRGIASLLVVIFHSNYLNTFLPNGYTEFLKNAWLWVDFFFILSGFILCYAYGNSFKANFTKKNYKNYILARFARVYPLHLITTLWMFGCAVVFVWLTGESTPVLNPRALPACILLIQSMHSSFSEPPLNNPSWSLSTEWWVYMIFPFLVPFFMKLKQSWWWLVAVCIICFYVFIRYVLGQINHNEPTIAVMTDFGFFRCLVGFFTGMLLFTLYQNGFAFNLFKSDLFFVAISIGLVLAMHFGIMDVIIIMFFPFILIAAAYNQTKIKRILEMKVLQRLGDWSFSIYLVHIPVIYSVKMVKLLKSHFQNPTAIKEVPIKGPIKDLIYQPNYLTGLLMCIIVLILTIAISALFYRYLEIPSRNYINNLFKSKHKKINPVSLEV